MVQNPYSWISVSPLSGSGNGTVRITIAANPNLNPRSGYINIGQQYLSVNQSAVLTASTTTLAPAPNPSAFGAPVTLTATVSPSSATGQVTFYDGTTVLGVGTLFGGVATLSTISLPAGSRSLRAYYVGDANYAASTSGWVTQTVNAQPANSFLAAVNYGVGTNPASAAAGDFNGDGKADLAVANAGSNNVSVLLGNGNGTFQAAVNYGAGHILFRWRSGTSTGTARPTWPWPTLTATT